MKAFLDYFLIAICWLAILINLLRIIKLLANPAFLKHPVFDFPTDKSRRVFMLLCGILVWVMLISLNMGWL